MASENTYILTDSATQEELGRHASLEAAQDAAHALVGGELPWHVINSGDGGEPDGYFAPGFIIRLSEEDE